MLTASTSTTSVAKGGFVRRSITLQPGGAKSIGLGIYDSKIDLPQFNITFEPNVQEAVNVSLERLDVPGQSRYMPFYKFKNGSDQPCTITVDREAE